MADYKEVLADLKIEFGKKIFLTPHDIAPLIGRSPAAQAMLRSRGSFPIVHGKMGGEVVIKIYDLARYIAEDNAEEGAAVSPKPLHKVVQKPTANRRGVSLGKTLFMFSANIQQVELQVVFMRQLFIELEILHLKKDVKKKPSRYESGGGRF